MFDKSDPSQPGHYPPSQTALFLLDYHQFVVDVVGPKGEATVTVASQMRDWARKQGIPVIHGLVDINETPSATAKGPKNIETYCGIMRSQGTDKVAAGLSASLGDDLKFYRRPGSVSAMNSKGLVEFLQQKGIKSLVVMGLATSGCVISTVAKADDEYVVTVIADGCADPSDSAHDALVGNILQHTAYVSTSSEFQAGYESRM